MKPSLLKAERKLRKWSQGDVAEVVGVSIKTVSRWEQGMAIPHPYYRDKLLALFNKTAEELGLLSDVDEQDTVQHKVLSPITQPTTPDVPMQTAFLADPIILQDRETANRLRGRNGSFIQQNEQKLHLSANDLFSYQSSWDHISTISTFQLFNRLSSRSALMPPKLLLSLAVITMVSLAFILHPLLHNIHIHIEEQQTSPISPKTSVEVNYGLPLYNLTIQNTDPSLLNTSQHFNQVFNAVYPQLVNRFALHPTTTVRNVTLTFSSNLSSSTMINGTTIIISSDWLRQHPDDFGLLTHELTLLLEQYLSGAPSWFADGMADYARSVYGPADDDNWSLPNSVQPQDSYLQGGGITARFLLWLEQHTTLDIVDQLNHALQTQQSFSTVFLRLTHHTVDELWNQYQGDPDISLTPEQLYKTIMSRKPFYQSSSLNLQISQPGSFSWSTIPRLSVSNFAIQADITIIRGDGGGFIFRWENKENNPLDPQYRIRIRPIADSTFGTFDLVYPNNNILAFGSSSAIKQGYNQTNRVTIIAQKHTIYLYVNSQFITKVDNDLSSNGTVALMANDDNNAADVWFKNIQVF